MNKDHKTFEKAQIIAHNTMKDGGSHMKVDDSCTKLYRQRVLVALKEWLLFLI
jgi:hypothetical protein